MLTYKPILGIVAVAIGFVSYVPYFKGILSGRTKPHAFSWLVWATLNAIAFAAQVVGKSGPGAWVTGCTALMCTCIFVLALMKGERKFATFDWLSLGGAALALLLWQLTDMPVVAVALITLTDVLGFLPTLKKGFLKPREENVAHFALGSISVLVALFAIETLTLTTWLYPAAIMLLDGSFAVILVLRRRSLTPR